MSGVGATTPGDGHRKSWPGPEAETAVTDENTPLLQIPSRGSGTGARHSVQVGESSEALRKRRTSSRAVADEEEDTFDINELVRHRSRLSSNVSVPEPEDVRKQLRIQDLEQAREDVAQIRIENAVGEGLGQIHEETEPNHEQDQTEGKAPPPSDRFIGVSRIRFWVVFSTILLGYFVACFDTTLMASSHPVITSYFDASKEASWLTTVFMITNTGFQPLFGRLSDTIGRKSCYLFVLFVFGITNLWCGLSQTIGSFIAARAVCGLGAGATMSVGLIILNDLVHVEYRGIYIAHVNLAFGLGSACGAAFGGVLCDSIGWRWAFGIQVPVLAVCFLGALFTVPKNLGPMLIRQKAVKADDDGDDRTTQTENAAWNAIKRFDSVGVSLLLVTITLLIVAINTGGNLFPWSSPIVIVCLVLSVVLAVVFLFVERRVKQPVMPLYLLIKPPIANMVFANFLGGIASNTVLFNVPLWFQAVKLSTPTASGLRLASPSIGGSIAGIFSGYMITWSRRLKPTVLLGAIVYLAGSIALLFIKPESSEVVSIVLITWVPTAQGFVYPSTMMSAFAICETDEQAVVTTTISLWRNLGIVLGVAISSLVFQNMLRINLEKLVTGPDRDWIINRARSAVGSIKDMHPPYQQQVMKAYAIALKLSFITALVASIIMFLLVAFVKLPRLGKGKKVEVGPGE